MYYAQVSDSPKKKLQRETFHVILQFYLLVVPIYVVLVLWVNVLTFSLLHLTYLSVQVYKLACQFE